MLSVICILCNDTGYTASPEQTRCGCGGKLRVWPEQAEKENSNENGREAMWDESIVNI